MDRNKCTYCNGYIYHPTPGYPGKVCERCEEQVKKLDPETVDWLMMVIDGRIEKELDEHTSRYSHEPSSYGYY